jgi:hypothetical protein
MLYADVLCNLIICFLTLWTNYFFLTIRLAEGFFVAIAHAAPLAFSIHC